MKRHRWRALGLALGLGSALSATATADEPPAEQAIQDTRDVLRALAPFVVYDTQPIRRVLYSWTTAEQVQALRDDQTLLRKGRDDRGRLSSFDQRLADDLRLNAKSNPPIVQHLRSTQTLRRFAWTNAFATLRGFDGESYGDQLIRITLAEDALVAVYTWQSGASTWSFHDVDGDLVPSEDVDVQRVAAVIHVGRGGTQWHGTFSVKAKPFREVVLVHPDLIATWEMGTEPVLDRLDLEIQALSTLRSRWRQDTLHVPRLESWQDEVVEGWKAPTSPDTPRSLYEASIAFPNARYQPTLENLDALIEALEHARDAQPEPLEPLEGLP